MTSHSSRYEHDCCVITLRVSIFLEQNAWTENVRSYFCSWWFCVQRLDSSAAMSCESVLLSQSNSLPSCEASCNFLRDIYVIHPGTCPQPAEAILSHNGCGEECLGDNECSFEKKCCTTSCGSTCHPPLEPYKGKCICTFSRSTSGLWQHLSSAKFILPFVFNFGTLSRCACRTCIFCLPFCFPNRH